MLNRLFLPLSYILLKAEESRLLSCVVLCRIMMCVGMLLLLLLLLLWQRLCCRWGLLQWCCGRRTAGCCRSSWPL